jgi:hypothetical protein
MADNISNPCSGGNVSKVVSKVALVHNEWQTFIGLVLVVNDVSVS